jgi:hypothetical protein
MYQVLAEKGITFASGALTLQTAPHHGGSPSGNTATRCCASLARTGLQLIRPVLHPAKPQRRGNFSVLT